MIEMDDVIGTKSVDTANLILDVVDRLRNYFSDFKPESKTLSIDFASKTSTIGFRITVPDDRRKNFALLSNVGDSRAAQLAIKITSYRR